MAGALLLNSHPTVEGKGEHKPQRAAGGGGGGLEATPRASLGWIRLYLLRGVLPHFFTLPSKDSPSGE